MALELRRLGISKVRPLVGGWHLWKSNGFPMEMPKDYSIPQSVVSIQ